MSSFLKTRTSKTYVSILVVCMLCVTGAVLVSLAQSTPEAVITPVGYSPYEVHNVDTTKVVSTGLTTVGTGSVAYLRGSNAEDDSVTAYLWAIGSQPVGSIATLSSTMDEEIALRPDVDGQYEVSLQITTAGGTADTTITITAAKYVGLGEAIYGGANNNCAPCHNSSGVVDSYLTTAHSTFLVEALDGIKSSHYNEGCIKCHTVGFDEDTLAVNDGFDDIAKALGWTFPDTLRAGEWDSLVTNYPTLAQRANIQCESCHGPASEHRNNFDPEMISVSLNEDVCGVCHGEEPYHRKDIQFQGTLHKNNVPEERTSCARCHGGAGFIEFADADVPTNTNHGDPGYTATALEHTPISCAVCHDPHAVDNTYQLRKLDATVYLMTDDPNTSGGRTEITWGGLGKTCMNCHVARRGGDEFASEINTRHNPHHGPQTDLMAGASAAEFGMTIPTSNHSSVITNACVDCHMADTPGTGQPGRDEIGEHTFAMKSESGVENVASCQTCHGPITSFDDITAGEDADGDGTVEGVQSEVKGLIETLAGILPVGFDQTGGLDTTYTIAERKAAFNVNYLVEDGSYGIHNAKYAIGILKESIVQLGATVGAGTIAAVLDVPNDQGRQVRLLWNKFAADTPSSLEPITEYSIWRQVDEDITITKAIAVESVEEMLANAKPNARYSVADTYWDYITSVPATRQDRYSTIVPTLYDTTTTEGIQYTTFMVGGHTDNPETFITSPVDSGYSVDNLAPTAPVSPKVITITTGVEVTITWDDPVDADFNYVEVIRADDVNFTSGVVVAGRTGETQIIDSDQALTLGTTVYYRLSSFDFAGNMSDYTEALEVVLSPLGVADGGSAIPTAYNLNQNAPNPFNPTTTIKYALPRMSHVELVIYDILGREVRRLVQETQPAGYHTVVWDGRNSSGLGVASGVYFYQIQAGSYTELKKMTLLK